MLHHSSLVRILDVRECVRTALVTDQKAVALREIACIVRTRQHLHQTAVAVLATSGRDTLADDTAACVLSDMDHLGSGVRLLHIVGHSHGIELRR